jgi:hypothetical protein
MSYRSIAGGLLLMAAHSAFASSWTLEDHEVTISGNDVSIDLLGGSSSGCIPTTSEVNRTGHDIRITLTPPAENVLCFSAFRPWEHSVNVADLPNGQYEVVVSRGEAPIGDFTFTLEVSGVTTFDRGFAPTQGMWWSSANPGTGLAFNVDNEGRWFGALYLYDEEGEPTFLTMQGASLAYNLEDVTAPYAIGTSPLIRSEGGQCLACPWSQATVSDTGDDAELVFHTATSATLKVGVWSLELTPLPMGTDEARIYQAPKVGEHYSLMLDAPSSGRHVAVVKAIPGGEGGFTGSSGVAFECVDCRTVDDAGSASASADEALARLIEEEIEFACVGTSCRTLFHETEARPVVSKDASRIDVVVNRVFGTPPPNTPDVGVTHIQFNRLSSDWRD